MTTAVKVAYVTCLCQHVYEVPADSQIVVEAERSQLKVISADQCLYCLQNRLDQLKDDAYYEEMFPLEEGEPNEWALEAAQVEKLVDEVRKLYVSPTSREYRLM